MTIAQFFLINLGAIISAAGGVFLKKLSISLSVPGDRVAWVATILASPNFWIGGLCYVLPIGLWTYLLRSMELTKLQPLLAIVYLYTILLAFVFLGEQPTMQRLLGIAFIVGGVVLVGRT